MRGEKYLVDTLMCYHIGSSPHARGKVILQQYENLKTRIIPACAGKSIYTTGRGIVG